jgi:hypothetical protein
VAAIKAPFPSAESITNHFATRLAAARDAQHRTRLAFIAATIAAVAISIAVFNTYFSWYTFFASKQFFPPATVSDVTRVAQEALIQDWVKSNRVTSSLLGVNFGVSDAPIIGSVTLFIISLWFFVCIRRENHLIADVLYEAAGEHGVGENNEKQLRLMVFHGIADYLIFTTISKDDEPRSTLGPRSDEDDEDKKLFWLRPSLQVLIFLPAIAIGIIFVSDVTSFFLGAAMRWPHVPLWREIIQSPGELVYAIFADAAALAFGIMTTFNCKDIRRFETCTGEVLRLYYKKYVK